MGWPQITPEVKIAIVVAYVGAWIVAAVLCARAERRRAYERWPSLDNNKDWYPVAFGIVAGLVWPLIIPLMALFHLSQVKPPPK